MFTKGNREFKVDKLSSGYRLVHWIAIYQPFLQPAPTILYELEHVVTEYLHFCATYFGATYLKPFKTFSMQKEIPATYLTIQPYTLLALQMNFIRLM